MDFETVFTTLNSAEADLVRSQLEAAGFEANVVSEYANLELATASGIRIQVPTEEAEDARALLAATVNTPTTAPDR